MARRVRPRPTAVPTKSLLGKPVHGKTTALSNQCNIEPLVAQSLASGTLDLAAAGDTIDDVALVALAGRLAPHAASIHSLVLSGSERISAIGVRSVAHAVGSELRRLVYARVPVQHDVLKVLTTRIEVLEDFIPCCNRSLRICNLSHCAMVTDDALCWLAGTIGAQGALTQCRKLRSLNLAQTIAITDRGLGALAIGCRALQFLNLEGLLHVTDIGLTQLARGCKQLRVVHLKRCVQISDVGITALGMHCPKLQSLNLCGIVLLTTSGLSQFVAHARALQVLDVQGCSLLTEQALCILATSLPALQHLNVTGCQQITENGLRTLATHLPFVQLATAFRGLEPKTNATELKFAHHKSTIAHSAALRLQAWYRGHLGRRIATSWRHVMVETPAANIIRRAYYRHRLRTEIAQRVAHTKYIARRVARIQALVRGVLVRMRIQRELDEAYALTVATRAAKRIQTRFRGFRIRRQVNPVNVALTRMYMRFAEERRTRCAVRVQRCYRRRLNRCRLSEVVGLAQRWRQQCHDAATKLQRLFRARAARALTRSLQRELEARRAWKAHCITMAIKLQSHWRRHASWRHLQRARVEFARQQAALAAAATRIEALVRGWFGRRAAHARRELVASWHAAAATIQRAWHAYLHPTSGTIEYAKLVSDIKWQLHLEAAEAEARKDALLARERTAAMRDSASEADSEDDWYEQKDSFWFSPSRNEREWTRPNRFAREKSLVGVSIRVFWPLEDAWFEGVITKFCASRVKHRIAYLDGDHEWLELDDMDETQLQVHNGSWMMYENYCPSALALKAALYVHVRFQIYSVEYFCWRAGWIESFDGTRDVFRVVYDDDATTMVDADLFGCEDEVQVQDKRSLQWFHLGTFFFGPSDPTLRVADYLAYVPPVYDATYESAEYAAEYEGDVAEYAIEWQDDAAAYDESLVAAADAFATGDAMAMASLDEPNAVDAASDGDNDDEDEEEDGEDEDVDADDDGSADDADDDEDDT
ncbi:hypothetical protein SPRG_07561 [Saprolegnia parasitica CBS 223.65]|uniref:F-box/LRR-repeat protein 15-like leucin rich repeat domain-containing protein n=1 Tax=Saprolegnia parasitica (strain CBS 223.65) TaxID=695850 RepID=A0A067CKJ4_SAPPC|nr:hypothetical protein SPRG_07561 [Saprolegnia parasitica CBS 223.65]KDO27312.1 hypothetical protein SPRG_07561 [Saprolegnia parasitica CBS 223.65]|eukprot:XP_012202085.1 hypothetical protein SPRG_07561 [Saprolegnia parasitica CBS 223.65]